jgi:type IV secretory pathway VirB10-like protein
MEQPVKDKAAKPQGLMPKNLQAMVIAGLAFLMIAIMALTGRRPPQPVAAPAAVTPPPPPPVDEAKILAFRNSIQKQQADSDAELERALLRRQALLAGSDTSSGANPYQPGTYPPGTYPPGTPPSDQIKEDAKRRRYQSLFADNVALTYRKDAAGMQPNRADVAAASVPPAILAQQPAQAAQQEFERQALAATPPAQTAPEPAKAGKPPESHAPAANPDVAKPGEFNSASGKRYVLFEGTVIEALLVNRLDGSFAGPVICMVSTDTYSHDGQHLLIPAGTKAIGEASKVDSFGQARLVVAFHRLLMPDGYSESLDQFKGLDQQGTIALRDKVNNHYLKIFGASLAVGLFSGLSEFNTGSALTSNGNEIIRQGFGVGMAESGEQIMNRFLNVMPTITIREGNRVKIYISSDLLLPDYNRHQMDPSL